MAVLELTAFAEEFHAFKTFEDTATGGDAAFAFQTGMLAHNLKKKGEPWGNAMGKAIAFFENSQKL